MLQDDTMTFQVYTLNIYNAFMVYISEAVFNSLCCVKLMFSCFQMQIAGQPNLVHGMFKTFFIVIKVTLHSLCIIKIKVFVGINISTLPGDKPAVKNKHLKYIYFLSYVFVCPIEIVKPFIRVSE